MEDVECRGLAFQYAVRSSSNCINATQVAYKSQLQEYNQRSVDVGGTLLILQIRFDTAMTVDQPYETC